MMTPRLMTGARPTGGLHVGQFLAAFEPFVSSSLLDDSFFIVSDLHMMTTKLTPKATHGLPQAIYRLMSEAIGFGVDPTKTKFYLQSSMPWQARIYVILQSLADRERLEKHGSFLEMANASKNVRNPSLGLLGYPVLESSDVLSIAATHVTVGDNNRSHFEHLSEMLSELNNQWHIDYPEPIVITGRRNLVGLDGCEKMSKSLNNAILFSDTPDIIQEKVKGMAAIGLNGINTAAEYLEALGASDNEVAQAREQISCTKSIPNTIQQHITDLLVELVEPVRVKSIELQDSPDYLSSLLEAGTAAANEIGASQYAEFVNSLGMLRVFE